MPAAPPEASGCMRTRSRFVSSTSTSYKTGWRPVARIHHLDAMHVIKVDSDKRPTALWLIRQNASDKTSSSNLSNVYNLLVNGRKWASMSWSSSDISSSPRPLVYTPLLVHEPPLTPAPGCVVVTCNYSSTSSNEDGHAGMGSSSASTNAPSFHFSGASHASWMRGDRRVARPSTVSSCMQQRTKASFWVAPSMGAKYQQMMGRLRVHFGRFQ
eukprot:293523-Chlamydomonas_euryale.AAC.3